MHHRLFIAEQVVAKARILLERLSNASDVAVPENSQETLKEAELAAVSFDVLITEVGNNALRGR